MSDKQEPKRYLGGNINIGDKYVFLCDDPAYLSLKRDAEALRKMGERASCSWYRDAKGIVHIIHGDDPEILGDSLTEAIEQVKS